MTNKLGHGSHINHPCDSGLSQGVHSISHIVFLIYDKALFLPKQCKKSRSILYDGSRSLGLFREGETHIIQVAKLHRTDLVICSHSREEKKTPSYSRINRQDMAFIHS